MDDPQIDLFTGQKKPVSRMNRHEHSQCSGIKELHDRRMAYNIHNPITLTVAHNTYNKIPIIGHKIGYRPNIQLALLFFRITLVRITLVEYGLIHTSN